MGSGLQSCFGIVSVSGFWYQPNLFSPSSIIIDRKRDHRRLANRIIQLTTQLGFWALFFVPAQRQGLRLESQACLSILSKHGIEFTNQTQKAFGKGEA